MNWLFLFIYLSLQLALGFYISRKIRDEDDYFLAGRNLGLPMVAISIFATWFGAETCIGSSAAIFSDGLSGGRADPFGYSLCLFFAGLFLASQLWKYKITTLGDFFRKRYNSNVEKLATVIMIPSSLIWSAAQVKAFGHILSVLTGTDPELTTIVATILVITYTCLGGLLADVITDIVQGGILAFGLILILILSFMQIGSIDQAIQQMDASRLSFIVPTESFWAQLDTWMVPILGSLVAQEMISRCLAANSADTARRGALWASGIYIVLGSIPVLIGLFGNQIIATELPHDDQFLPTIAQTLLPHGLFLIFSAAIVSAILSTIDSSLLAVSAFATHNLMGEHYRKLSPLKKVLAARATVIAGGIAAYIISLFGESIYELVETASAFGAAGILICVLGGLYLKKFAGAWTAAAAMIVGVSAHPVYELVFELEAPFMATIATSAIVYLAGGWLESKLLKTSNAEPIFAP